jgi:hypothetical protein
LARGVESRAASLHFGRSTEVGRSAIIAYPALLGAVGGRLLINGVDVWAEDVTRNAGLALDSNRQFGWHRLVLAQPVENRGLVSTYQLAERRLAS